MNSPVVNSSTSDSSIKGIQRPVAHPLLPLFQAAPEDPNVKFLVELLDGQDWLSAERIRSMIMARTERRVCDRWVRAIAAASKGQIAGGQHGYKLVRRMTAAEYQHWRNWMKSQADEMTARILRSDKIFYRRQPVSTGHGILSPTQAAASEPAVSHLPASLPLSASREL